MHVQVDVSVALDRDPASDAKNDAARRNIAALLAHIEVPPSERDEVRAHAASVARAVAGARAGLDDLLADYDDAALAVDEACAERALGLACSAGGAVEARVHRLAGEIVAAHAYLAILEARHERLCLHLRTIERVTVA